MRPPEGWAHSSSIAVLRIRGGGVAKPPGRSPPSSADEECVRPKGGRILHLLQCCGFGEEGWRSRPDGVPHPPQMKNASARRVGAFFIYCSAADSGRRGGEAARTESPILRR